MRARWVCVLLKCGLLIGVAMSRARGFVLRLHCGRLRARVGGVDLGRSQGWSIVLVDGAVGWCGVVGIAADLGGRR